MLPAIVIEVLAELYRIVICVPVYHLLSASSCNHLTLLVDTPCHHDYFGTTVTMTCRDWTETRTRQPQPLQPPSPVARVSPG
jgi:hypothetical protein